MLAKMDRITKAKYEGVDLCGLSNRSVLIIDDNHSLHRDYNAVLCPEQYHEDDEKLNELEEILLGKNESNAKPSRERNFKLQSAFQGEEAAEIVQRHLAKSIHYPIAFVDMRMPPGWDGLETIKKLRAIDPKMRFVIVTAYSDHSEEEIEEELGRETPVTIAYKPFEPIQLYMMTVEIVTEWNNLYGSSLEQ